MFLLDFWMKYPRMLIKGDNMRRSFGEVTGDAFFTLASKYPMWVLFGLLLVVAGLDFYGRFYRRINTDNVDLMERWIKLETWRNRAKNT
jgi:hypothetical protein